MNDLGEGMNTGIGATGTDDHRLRDTEGAGQCFAQDADDRRELRLVGEAGKRVAVVGDVQTPTLDV